jgi:aspartate/methionine/tyrosine aminotransferase
MERLAEGTRLRSAIFAPTRLERIQPFGIETVARAAERSDDVLRLENLDTDLAPPPEAIAATRAAVGTDDANSYLPFTGMAALRSAVAARLQAETGAEVDPDRGVVICSGGLAGMLSALLATVDAGDEVIVTDPSYAGILARVRLAGAIPREVALRSARGHWRLDLAALAAAAGPRTRAVLLADPSMPTGAVLDDSEWSAVAELCDRTGAVLLYDAAFQRVRYDDRAPRHPATRPGLEDRTLTIGSVAKELRMIGWRIGWIAGPPQLVERAAQTVIYNTVVPSGFAQIGAHAALTATDDGVATAVVEWRRRRDTVAEQLEGLPFTTADGAWSLLLDAEALGRSAPALSEALLANGAAATPMSAWGEQVAPRHVRFVFSNEPVERLQTLRERLDAALADGSH